jgi:ABC-2 type transport system ATP-binding protein
MTNETLLQARCLSRRYGKRIALDGVDIAVGRGEVVGLLGPNGAGKSTTLRILSGTLPPHAGTVEIAGVDLFARPRAAKRQLGYLPEIPPVYPEMTVEAYLAYCGTLHGLRRRELRQALERTLARCQLLGVRRRLIGNLSKGYMQRVGVAQAVLHDPLVLILDEPTVGLDPLQIREIRSLIDGLRTDRAVILSSHILPEIQALCDRVVILRNGRSVFSGPVAVEGGRRIRLRCARSPDVSQLKALTGVESVQAVEDGDLYLTLSNDDTAAARVQQLVLAAGWGLREWALADAGLEQLFVSLVHGEPT